MACNRRMSVYGNAMFCYDCGKNYRRVREPVCMVCGKPIYNNADTTCASCKRSHIYFERNVSRYLYKGCIKDAIRNMKFKRREWISFEFGKAMTETVNSYYGDIDFDMILYVPMTKLSEATRGFNQSYEIASVISEKMKIPVGNNILNKKINVRTQSGLSRKERLLNVKDAFYVSNSEKLTDKVVLLIDDVYTTGATVNECAKVLKKSGALAVYTATVANTVFDE